MKTSRRIITALCIIITVSVIGFFLFGFKPLETAMCVGAGSKAKFLCSNVFISFRTPESVLENEACNATRDIGFLGLLGDALTTCDVDRNDQSVSCRLLWIKRKAVFQDHLGATLLFGTTEAQIRDSENMVRSRLYADVPPGPPPMESAPWPAGDNINAESVSGKIVKELDRLLEKAFDDADPENPGRTHGIVIVYDGKLIAERYATQLGYSAHTPHYGWSMTKSVASVLTGILAKQGKIDIYKPAPIKHWQNPMDSRHAVTTDQLLRMSSGLTFNENYDNPISDVNIMLFGNLPDMVEFAANKPLLDDPDTLWQYSTGTSTLLGAVIQNCLDRPEDFQTFARKELFDKLGMRSAIIESDQSGNPGTGSYMWATPRDWARFGLFCLQNGRWNGEQILPETWMKYAATPTPTDLMGHYGAQFWVNTRKHLYPSLPADLYECAGKDGQHVTVIPSQKLVIARFGYTPDTSGWDHEGFVREVIRALRPQKN